ncbi:hypothetical protein HPB49_003632 [Dermacentor silvarum]|uniref:Uncharacterized protein n=1 Tax=Dermacentor silvarum TaxID=543639 RepID=A0ACB8CPL7_DERSI|nr:hypothetical protein HPB49_003632 [Dermacentor silvarum]
MVRCASYKPRAQFCTVCSGIGHRADVCPNTEVIKCLTCGLTLDSQNQLHTCCMGCPHCGGDHQARDSRCEVRAAADRALRQTQYARRLRLRVPAKDLEKAVQPSSRQQQFIPLTTLLTQAAFVADSSTLTAKPCQNKSASQARSSSGPPSRSKTPPLLPQWTSWPGHLNLTGYSGTPFSGKSTKQPFLNSSCPKPNIQPTAPKPPQSKTRLLRCCPPHQLPSGGRNQLSSPFNPLSNVICHGHHPSYKHKNIFFQHLTYNPHSTSIFHWAESTDLVVCLSV